MNKGNSFIESENSNSFRFIPLKEQILKLDESISNIRDDYNENIKNASIVRNQMKQMDDNSRIKCSELTYSLINDIKNFEYDFNQMKESNKNELYLIKQEVQGIINEKRNIMRLLMIVNTRLSQLEHDIGVGYSL